MDAIIQQHRVSREADEPEPLEIGQWYWVTDPVREPDPEEEVYEEDEGTVEPRRWLGCITHVGSNYAELSTVSKYDGRSYSRIHFDEFDQRCEREPNAEAVLAGKVEQYRREAQRLMGQINEVTARLAITPKAGIPDGQDTEALVLRSSAQPIEEYKEALILAKKETLPALFEELEDVNRLMGNWMKAGLLPMKARAEEMKSSIKLIEGRIFNVELYAGLIEEVKQIVEGEPAAMTEPIRLFQRRAYMDEECLAQYRTGGMTFKNIPQFDKWLVAPENLNRLLPHPRCLLAFQVRRHHKERHFDSFQGYVRFVLSGERDWDKATFLYMRNGEQVFRLTTGIEFGARLFPDLDRAALDRPVYAKMFAGYVDKLISEGHYLELVKEDEEARKEHDKEVAESIAQGEEDGPWHWPYRSSLGDYELWTPESVLYDDIAEHIKKQIDEHNRVVIVLQGLLDRSPVFHPHPPWQLWNPESFAQAIELIYDDSRALVGGAPPDFEAYRTRLNETIKVGSITVGQEKAWLRVEADRENKRRANDWRRRSNERYELTEYEPWGNPGPGRIAPVQAVTNKGCRFEWTKERVRPTGWGPNTPIPCSLTVPKTALLHVNAYQPGDFKQFFADPRTRADYIKWAPLLLEAEEWHAGNRKKPRNK